RRATDPRVREDGDGPRQAAQRQLINLIGSDGALPRRRGVVEVPPMRPTLSCVVLSVTAFFTTAAQAELRLPAIFAAHMVVQRDREVPVWGWGDPGETVTVTLGGKTAKGSV